MVVEMMVKKVVKMVVKMVVEMVVEIVVKKVVKMLVAGKSHWLVLQRQPRHRPACREAEQGFVISFFSQIKCLIIRKHT